MTTTEDSPVRKYTIRTDYRRGNKLVKSTYGHWAANAVPNATRHLQTNEYGATVVEVYDMNNGVVHAVLTNKLNHGKCKMEILFKREVTPAMAPKAKDGD